MGKISTILGLFLAWTPLIILASTYSYFQWFTDGNFGLASLILNKYVAPIVVGAAVSLLCLVLNTLRIFFSHTFEAKWYDKFGFWSQGVMILVVVMGFTWLKSNL